MINNSKLRERLSTFKAILNHKQNERLPLVERLSNRVYGDMCGVRIL